MSLSVVVSSLGKRAVQPVSPYDENVIHLSYYARDTFQHFFSLTKFPGADSIAYATRIVIYALVRFEANMI